MTYQLTVVYHQPDDTEAFDAHYTSTHAPLAQKIPGLRGYTSFKPAPGDDGPAAEYLLAELTFDDADAFGTAMQTEEAQAATGDVANFATGGATMLAGEVTTYV